MSAPPPPPPPSSDLPPAGFGYDDDVLTTRRHQRPPPREVPIRRGLVVEERRSTFTGAIVRVEAGAVVLEDGRGHERNFHLSPGAFAIDGERITLVPPVPKAQRAGIQVTRSGSIATPRGPAKVAKASRILVEGVHDADLLERVWGDDLRHEGIVVEPLHGIDDLAGEVRIFQPAPTRRLGVLVDHLVPGSKESRIVAEVSHPHVLITGHPYIDIWEGIKPAAVGIEAWPVIPRGTSWKEGVCAVLGVDHPATMWQRILTSVDSYADLERPLIGAVEQLIDFVTELDDVGRARH